MWIPWKGDSSSPPSSMVAPTPREPGRVQPFWPFIALLLVNKQSNKGAKEPRSRQSKQDSKATIQGGNQSMEMENAAISDGKARQRKSLKGLPWSVSHVPVSCVCVPRVLRPCPLSVSVCRVTVCRLIAREVQSERGRRRRRRRLRFKDSRSPFQVIRADTLLRACFEWPL